MKNIYILKDHFTGEFYTGKCTPFGQDLSSVASIAKRFPMWIDAYHWGLEHCGNPVEIERYPLSDSKQFNAGAHAQRTISELTEERDLLNRALTRSNECLDETRQEVKDLRAVKDTLVVALKIIRSGILGRKNIITTAKVALKATGEEAS